ncbi:MAG: two-component regulator propeller domain-containing protein [Bacteroidota bacterium]
MMRYLFPALILSLIFQIVGYTQSYKFKFYGIEQGLPEQFIYSIQQDNNGYLWIATGSGMAKFDGLSFIPYGNQQDIYSNFINVSYIDSRNTIWLGHKNGSVSTIREMKTEPLIHSGQVLSIINDIKEDDRGKIWIASQSNGIIVTGPNENTKMLTRGLEDVLVYSLQPVDEKIILLGTSDGLYFYDIESGSLTGAENTPNSAVFCIARDKKNCIWIGTEDEGVFKCGGINEIKPEPFRPDLEMDIYKIQQIYFDRAGNMWVSTFGNGIYKFSDALAIKSVDKPLIFNTRNGLTTDNVKCVFQDAEENIFIGTYGEGLASLVDDYFTFYGNSDLAYSNNIQSVFSDDKNIWLGTDNSLIEIAQDSVEIWKNIDLSGTMQIDKITSIYKDVAQSLWLGTESNGLFRYDIAENKAEKIYLSEDQLTNSINFIDGYGNHLWIATRNGVVRYNTISGETFIYNTSNGLPHNNINHLFLDINERIWISTQSNDLFVITPDYIIKYKISNNNEILKINAITQNKDGRIWIATYGNGVYVYDNKSFVNFNTFQGLKSNYCYNIIHDENSNIWVGHRQGLSRISHNGSIKTFGKTEGIMGDCNKNAVYKDIQGRIWFGTTSGVVQYNYLKDRKNKVAPATNITAVYFSDQLVAYAEGVSMPYGAYKLNIEFIGISHSDPKGVKYRYMLKGFDLDWNETYDRRAFYNRIEDGEYEFLIKSCNCDGLCNDVPVSLKITIAPPIWKKTWFIILAFLLVVYIIYLIIKIREKNHRKLQEYLQKTLDERTREVVEQKEEIEMQRDKLEQANQELKSKNKDITDSINYAQRIQAAILPQSHILEKQFPESFIFYRPRDIVSGDFYWFERIGNRFVIVCADATGHGVPGAFMSLISITLIKDFLKNEETATPGKLLSLLDEEIRFTLSQEKETISRTPTDGLDVSICEICLDSHNIVLASAMRPVYIHTGGRFIYLKGSRFPIGGVHTKAKAFREEKLPLGKGDTIYLFSDGYPDQFGGDSGKKMKMVRFRNILEKAVAKDMHEQHRIVEHEFDTWRGDYGQVDDVLFMGIKI